MQIREEPPPYSSPIMKRYESFENPLASQSFDSRDDDQNSSANVRYGSALYDFTAGGDDEVSGLSLFTLCGLTSSSVDACCEHFSELGFFHLSVQCHLPFFTFKVDLQISCASMKTVNIIVIPCS